MIVLGGVLAKHVLELRGRARVRPVSGRGGSGSFGSRLCLHTRRILCLHTRESRPSRQSQI